MVDVSLRDIVKIYGDTLAVKGIDLDIDDGSFVVFVGPSGCGKSTLLRMIAGLETISYGEVRIGGALVNDLASRDRGVAMVFQSYALYPHMTVSDNLGFGLKVTGHDAATIATRRDLAALTLGLEPYLDRRPSQLSGGQKQRVAIGRAMVREPKVFLFDEPLSNLDAKMRNQTRIEIKRLQRQLKATVIFVTHDQVEAMTLADKIVVLNEGRIAQTGTPMEVYQRPASRFVASFIGAPSMNFFDAALEGSAIAPVVRLGEQTVAVDPALFDLPPPGTTVVIGVRPEHIVPRGHGAWPTNGVELHGTVNFVEMLGNESLLFVNAMASAVGGEVIMRMANPRAIDPDERIAFKIDTDRLHVFDHVTEMSLRRPS